MIQVKGVFAAGGEEFKRANGTGDFTVKNSTSSYFTVTSLSFRPKMFMIDPLGAGYEEADGKVRVIFGNTGGSTSSLSATFYNNGFRLDWRIFSGLPTNGLSGTANWYAIG